jgi:hypothetical protein
MQGILLLYLYRSIGEGGLAIDPGVAAGLVGAYGGGSTCRQSSAAGWPIGYWAASGCCSTAPS